MVNFCVSSDRLDQTIAALEARRLGIRAQQAIPLDALAVHALQVEGGAVDLPAIAEQVGRAGALVQEATRIDNLVQGLRQVPCFRGLTIAAGVASLLGICGIPVTLLLHAGDGVVVGSAFAAVCGLAASCFGFSRVEQRLEAYEAYRTGVEREGDAPVEPEVRVDPDLGLPVDANGIIIE